MFSTPKIFPGIFSNTFSSYQNFLSTPPTTVLSLFPTVPSIHNVSDASFVLYHHRAFGSPVLSTFLKAIRAGYLASIPRLTATIVLRNPPLSLATSFGHLDACRKGLHSTRQSFPPSLLALTRAQHRATLTNTPPLTPIPLHVPPPTIASPSLDFGPTLYANLTHRSEWMATDLTGRYPVPSRLGHEYVLVTRYLGYIRLTPQVSRTKYAYRDSFRDILAFFSSRSKPIYQVIMDNEKSDLIVEFFRENKIQKVEFVPPGDHRTNPAERSIQTVKKHITSSLATCHVSFPPDLWHLLVPTMELSLNSLRAWKPDPTRSAYDGMHGFPMDFFAHPLHPVGQLCVAHVPALQRQSWGHHGLRAHYIGPATDHYRCDKVFIAQTQTPSISHTVAHYPDPLFHWANPETPPALAIAHPLRPHPTPDGSDLLGKGFVDPELGLCTVSSLADPILLQPGTGNLTPGVQLAPGYHHALVYSDPTGSLHTSSVPEVAQWVCTLPPPEPIPPVPVPSAGVLSATRAPLLSVPSAPSAGVPSARKDDTPSDKFPKFLSDGYLQWSLR